MNAPSIKMRELFSPGEVSEIVSELAANVCNSFGKLESVRPLVVCPVMDAAMVFAADFIREIDFACIVAPVKVSSYRGMRPVGEGEVEESMDGWMRFIDPSRIKHYQIVVLDTVLDTGRTLDKVKRFFDEAGAIDVLTCVLLDKRVGRTPADFTGRIIGNRFVVGYVLDLDGYCRGLPDIREVVD